MTKRVLSTKEQVLSRLLDQHGDYVSGDELAQQVGVSRESIWKAIQKLKADGHHILSKKKTGYAYQQSGQLEEAVLAKWLKKYDTQLLPLPEIHLFDTIDSTQTYAKEYVGKHPSLQPRAFIAREQSGGYGRQGRDFYSPKNAGLYVSLALPIQTGEDLVPSLLTTSAAVALVNGLQAFFPQQDFKLKWVNDLILRQHKVGGVITEGVFNFESQQYSAVIIGFAINVLPVQWPAALASKVGSVLLEDEENVDLNQLLAKILIELLEMAEIYRSGCYLGKYRDLSILIDHAITVKVGTETLTGVVQDISDQGGLVLLNSETGRSQTLYAGEVTKVKLLENLNL
ncbi:biotin--[acetyl-CoA-carboxylase] ligase [Fructobacillus pseudoficulneus]|uniref:biotin--[biotin carboxyl-carrier protein] ligase n=1 Tax=Fructobacillus pseudoficulneus TaxID=220714 RepID=A0A3F3GR80_9LACO|nr:biotin--[acetyl-CoA-carboxylase] ligase [Fructobacillus pseudoficulneus]GAP02225.1 biotin--[acetyl-CoA-carboxylase] ligase [Fructobacillus pseudoficulneus]SEH36118.1 BirA family transcriptional regulator, biotin operon repressor / biotin-[acetyl-CoA-carboxylase] ligase [Fructobacillus pseudoficulneus]